MKIFFIIGLLIGLLSGCASRNPCYSESRYTYKDSLKWVQLDSSILSCNRQMQIRLRSQIQQIAFSDPDSFGKQHIQTVAFITEEWEREDSVDAVAVQASVAEMQQGGSATKEEKVTVKEKRHTVWWIAGLLLIVSFISYFLVRK